MADFWRNSGYHLLEHHADRHLAITDDFLRAYFLRPEIAPVDESGPLERALHESLLDAPRRPVPETDLAGIEDADARFNYGVLLGFRQRLLDSASVERCYLSLFRGGDVTVPPLFIDQLAQIIARNVLDGCDDPLQVRMAELFFREQKITIEQGSILAADLETIEMHASGNVYGNLGRLIVEAQTPMKSVHLDVLDRDNAPIYWQRDQRHDLVVSLNHGRAALDSFARVLERWIEHFTGLRVGIKPVRSISDAKWVWHVGLDAQSNAILNALWRGESVEQGDLQRLLCLFRMETEDATLLKPEVRGRPIYLALAMNEHNVVRMKPQNLLTNLPLVEAA